ncbi:unnamed protein product [Didymodactylos carnosus]|uniref:Uncharacterized protein n=1 Tax=Didymodactylos carnosus TaxID=1234261 RepID=A0A814DI55_9BILA|nr:unnamed protein product [Didymodactylos carnosus]CAF3729941.1 unnamed protein product [Didymodactylos carnosus]
MYWDSTPSIDLCEMHDELLPDTAYMVDSDQRVLNINFAEMGNEYKPVAEEDLNIGPEITGSFERNDAQDDVVDRMILEEETTADADIVSMQDDDDILFMGEQDDAEEDNDIMIAETKCADAEDDDVVFIEWKCTSGDDDDVIFLEYKQLVI